MSTTELSPFIAREPGDLITADDWNGMQRKIKDEIRAQTQAAREELKREGVDRADNADHFATMSESDLTDKLDERYAPKVHDHEGPSAYRRYIKEFTKDPGLDKVLLEHGLGRFPLVDVYQLLPVAPSKFPGCKLIFYYGHADADELGLRERVGRSDWVYIGIPFEEVLRELGVEYSEDNQIEDVLNEMWDAFLRDPNDEIEHCTTAWVDECCGERRTIRELKEAGDWDDLRLALRPRKCGLGTFAMSTEAKTTCIVEVRQLTYSTLFVDVATNALADADLPLDLMILLRS
jgi:hypothetical protein